MTRSSNRAAGGLRVLAFVGLTVGLTVGLMVEGAAASPPADWLERCQRIDPESGEASLDAIRLFDYLVDRYRDLESYEDVAEVLQVTQRDGQPPRRVETRIGCGIENGKLRVDTPASHLRRFMGLDLPFRTSPALDEAVLEYQIWLAPHMALKFESEPRQNFRRGVRGGFEATAASEVTIDDRPMVHLELRSADDDDKAPAAEATFDLYLNRDSLLVERITGHQRLPDGSTYETSLDITPTVAVSGEPAEPAELETPAAAPPIAGPGPLAAPLGRPGR